MVSVCVILLLILVAAVGMLVQVVTHYIRLNVYVIDHERDRIALLFALLIHCIIGRTVLLLDGLRHKFESSGGRLIILKSEMIDFE